MAAWETGDMSAALPDSNPAAPAAANTEGAKVNPQGAGWVKPTAYDYATYNKTTKEMAETLQNEDEAAAEPVVADDEDAVGGLGRDGWANNAAVYEWNEDFGDVGPRFPELEKMLFGSQNHTRSGIKFDKIRTIQVIQESETRIKPIERFEDAGLHPVMLENLKLAGYALPTPIQRFTLPTIFEDKDLIACAQTGSGKTAAFLIPILSKLMGKAKKLCAARPNPATFVPGSTPGVRAEPLVLIIAPTRELATQIFDEARRFCYRTMFRPCVVYGGGPIAEQIAQLQKGCDLLIGTPGRLVDFINRPHLLTLKRLKFMVIDEADEMVQSDWETELKQIMSGGDQEEGNINYLMFSATFPKICRELAEQHLAHNHVRIRVGRAGSTHDNIKQDVVFAEAHAKRQCLLDLLISMPPARTIIFVNTKRTADEVDDYLFNLDFPCTSIHGDRTQREREDSIRSFRKGKTPVLIATGVSARGLDIHNVMHVINYDLPSMQYGGIQEYIHRIGRTGRIGNMGLATSFYNSRDSDMAEILVKTLLETRQKIPDFLEEFIPEGYADGKGDLTKLNFEDEEFEADMNPEGAEPGDAWGSDEPAEKSAQSPAADDAWGEPVIRKAERPGGWGVHPDTAPSVPLATGGWGAQQLEPAQAPAPVALPTPQPFHAAPPQAAFTGVFAGLSAASYGAPAASYGAPPPVTPTARGPALAPATYGAPAASYGAPPPVTPAARAPAFTPAAPQPKAPAGWGNTTAGSGWDAPASNDYPAW